MKIDVSDQDLIQIVAALEHYAAAQQQFWNRPEYRDKRHLGNLDELAALTTRLRDTRDVHLASGRERAAMMDWWHGLSQGERNRWLDDVGVIEDAWAAHQRRPDAAVTPASPPLDVIPESLVRDPTPDEAAGMTWWNNLTLTQRQHWSRIAGDTGRVVDCWTAYQRHTDAP